MVIEINHPMVYLFDSANGRSLQDELDVLCTMEGVDNYSLDTISNQITKPDVLRHHARHNPQHWNDRERQCKRDKQRHAVLTIKLIDNHQHIDVAEWYEAQGEHTQSGSALGQHVGLVATKQACDATGENPHEQAGGDHSNGDEAETSLDDGAHALVIPPAHVNGTQRLQRWHVPDRNRL